MVHKSVLRVGNGDRRDVSPLLTFSHLYQASYDLPPSSDLLSTPAIRSRGIATLTSLTTRWVLSISSVCVPKARTAIVRMVKTARPASSAGTLRLGLIALTSRRASPIHGTFLMVAWDPGSHLFQQAGGVRLVSIAALLGGCRFTGI